MDISDKRSSRPKARQSIAHLPSSSSSRSSDLDKQGATIDLSAVRGSSSLHTQAQKKRSRGKSIGPGGLEALKETDCNITKSIPGFHPRSILKPTVPLTPPKNIPTFDELRQHSTTKKRSAVKQNAEALLIDFSTPGPSRDAGLSSEPSNAHANTDPFSPIQTANHERDFAINGEQNEDEGERMRQERKKLILEQRAARRKSMANRRVSFAPEATLHTWSVMELVEDSTTSSASNSTRRQSSLTAQQTPRHTNTAPETDSELLGTSEPPSTPPEQAEALQVQVSPVRQRDLHQKKRRRRSSAMSIETDASGDEVYSSSPSGDVAAESSPIRVAEGIESDSDTDGDTAMSMDEMTQNSLHSQDSGSSTHSSLDQRLRQAASQAGTKGIEYDEHGDDLSMELAGDTVTNAFQPWAQNRGLQPQSLLENQENIDPFSPAQNTRQNQTSRLDEDITAAMEMTSAVGGILGQKSPISKSRRKSALSRRRSSVGRKKSEGAEPNHDDESMDLTTMAGGILVSDTQDQTDSEHSGEEMTMEFTSAVGGLQDSHRRRQSTQSPSSPDNEAMDMTAAVGGILAPIEEQTEPQTDAEDDKTVAMETTRATGHIIGSRLEDISSPKQLMLDEMNGVRRDSSNLEGTLDEDGNAVQAMTQQFSSVASETGSPSLALKPRASGRTRSGRRSQSATPKSATRVSTSPWAANKQTTPQKQLTPIPQKSTTPERTPVAANITHRGASPKKLFQKEIQAKMSPAVVEAEVLAGKPQDPIFAQDEFTGRHTPRVVLHASKPHQHLRRRSSGIGIDQEGYGSPSVTQLLSRRSSIGDAAAPFKLEGQPATRLRFEDPKQLGLELDAERTEEERRESGRFIMEQEANEHQEENATLQLKDMIESMTPSKGKVIKARGRKSLAVGSARGLLGKRPAELDSNDEDDEESTPKRLKAVSKEGSPVKNIHLPKPPTKAQTTGRLTKAEQLVLDHTTNGSQTPTMKQSPLKASRVSSPPHAGRYKDVPATLEPSASFEDKLDNVIGAIDPSIEHPSPKKVMAEEDKISLPQFLTMTNIHFIELNTTKRRHTMAQSLARDAVSEYGDQNCSVGTCLAAATSTVPLLELYQHATRELKSYISEGRKIIRSIEAETLADQPPLFKEYIDARPDVKLVMDNQFRNGKTNARLQSKEGWYTWRSQLVEGLQKGLEGIHSDMNKDFGIVEKQADAVSKAVIQLESEHRELTQEVAKSKQRVEEIESIDHSKLQKHREELRSVNEIFRSKASMLKDLRSQMEDKDEALSQANELKEEMVKQMSEANKVVEEHRGWSVKDVLNLRAKVDSVAKETGWSLLAAEEHSEEPIDLGVALTITYKKVLRLFFYLSAYQPLPPETRRRSGRSSQSVPGSTAPISLTFSPVGKDIKDQTQLPTEQRFFLQLSQSQLHTFSMMPKGTVNATTILNTVSSCWDMAGKITEEVRLLNLTGVTRVLIQGDEKLAVKLMLMIGNRNRVDIEFGLGVTVVDDGSVSISTSIVATGIYGPVQKLLDESRTRRVQNALNREVGSRNIGEGAWAGAIQAFQEWHKSQPRAETQVSHNLSKVETNTVELGQSASPISPVPSPSKMQTVKRSPLAVRKPAVIQKKNIPVSTSRQDKLKTSQREQPIQLEKIQAVDANLKSDKENLDPFTYGPESKAPAITPEMQEAMMQRTPIKRIGALRRSPV